MVDLTEATAKNSGDDLQEAFEVKYEGRIAQPDSLLGSVITGRRVTPPKMLLYGVPGIGKSTFGAQAPSPIFCPTEDGFGLLDVPRFPTAKSWEDIIRNIGALYQEKHEYQTLVLDSLDEMEPLLFDYTARKHGKEDIEAFGYGKGFSTYAPAEMRTLMDGLEALRSERGMAILLIGHSDVMHFDAPDTDAYDRYTLRMQKHLRPIVEDWADTILFANYRVIVKKGEEKFGKAKTRGIGEGERIVFTEERPAWTAKNRWGLPSEMPFSYANFSAALGEAINPTTQNETKDN